MAYSLLEEAFVIPKLADLPVSYRIRSVRLPDGAFVSSQISVYFENSGIRIMNDSVSQDSPIAHLSYYAINRWRFNKNLCIIYMTKGEDHRYEILSDCANDIVDTLSSITSELAAMRHTNHTDQEENDFFGGKH